jgi:serine/threonine protein kinase
MRFAHAVQLADPPETPAWIGTYRIFDCIAEGGMGRVFRAQDTMTGRTVAMKLTRTGATAEMVALCREAEALRSLGHPGIVRFIDEGTWLGAPWLALELLEGRTLLDEMETSANRARYGSEKKQWPPRRSEELPTAPARARTSGVIRAQTRPESRPLVAAGRLNEVAAIVVELATILDHLHSRCLVHRDLKPANVFLRTAADGGVRPTLIDFGLACRANTPRSANGPNHCVGTMSYAAPEQIRGDPVDARTDVYSLGCILYELVTGIRPFDGGSDQEVAQKHLYREAIAPSELVWGLPWQLEDLLLDMLAKKPSHRPTSAGAAGARLAVAAQRAVGAGLEGWSEWIGAAAL